MTFAGCSTSSRARHALISIGLDTGDQATRYSGAHAIWVDANEPRAACAVGQVAAADSLDLARTSWKDSGIDVEAYTRLQAIRWARGEIAPLPQATDKAPNLNGWAHFDKVLGYRPVDDASRISIPLLVIDAENEELFDRHQAGELTVTRAKANGARAEYRVIPEITHYDVYRRSFEESAQMALDWFIGCFDGLARARTARPRRHGVGRRGPHECRRRGPGRSAPVD